MRYHVLSVLAALTLLGCQRAPDLESEPWRDDPVPRWPIFALTNQITLPDTTYHHMGNAFWWTPGRTPWG